MEANICLPSDSEAERQVKGYPGFSYKKHKTPEEAQLFIDAYDMTQKALSSKPDPRDALPSIIRGMESLSLDHSSSTS